MGASQQLFQLFLGFYLFWIFWWLLKDDLYDER